jgi:hypothetical protein
MWIWNEEDERVKNRPFLRHLKHIARCSRFLQNQEQDEEDSFHTSICCIREKYFWSLHYTQIRNEKNISHLLHVWLAHSLLHHFAISWTLGRDKNHAFMPIYLRSIAHFLQFMNWKKKGNEFVCLMRAQVWEIDSRNYAIVHLIFS